MKNKSLFKITENLMFYKAQLVICLVCSFINALVSILIPYVTQNLVDTASVKNIKIFYYFLIISAATLIIGTVSKYFYKFSSSSCTLGFTKDMREKIAMHVQKMPVYLLENYPSGDILSRINNDLSSISNFYTKVFLMIFNPLLAVLSLIYMISISLKLTIFTMVLVPLTSIIFNKINKPIQKFSKSLMEKSSVVNEMIEDNIKGLTVLKAFNMYEPLTEKFKKVNDNMKNTGIKIALQKTYLVPIFLALQLIPALISPIAGGYLAYRHEISLGSLFAFQTLVFNVVNPVKSVLDILSLKTEILPACKRINDLLCEPEEENFKDKLVMLKSDSAVQFKDVSFSYKNSEKVLDNISFDLIKGSFTALVGKSGCGKSTILKLLCGFYKPESGQIKILGTNLDNKNIEKIRSFISYMPQEAYMYPLTIAENIKIAKSDASMEDVINAAKLANADEFIVDLKDGYNTIVSEGGSMLSGGQRQRISLARMILKDAPIMLLDEPTASLDSKSEALIELSLENLRKRKTIIMSAHRLKTVKKADKILVINDLMIKESGNHDELILENGLYQKLYAGQGGI